MKQASLLFLLEDNRILLAMKKRGFGHGRWNGVGGKPNKGETIEQTAMRECLEEIKVQPKDIKEVAKLNFYFPKSKENLNQQVIVYFTKSWRGEPAETAEMSPKWFSISEIPYESMWSDDKYWLPEVLDGHYVEADFHFDDNDQIIKKSVNKVS
jgi:8-oxo-dGTP pyrophosphatase MutT (NUDIX family)